MFWDLSNFHSKSFSYLDEAVLRKLETVKMSLFSLLYCGHYRVLRICGFSLNGNSEEKRSELDKPSTL